MPKSKEPEKSFEIIRLKTLYQGTYFQFLPKIFLAVSVNHKLNRIDTLVFHIKKDAKK